MQMNICFFYFVCFPWEGQHWKNQKHVEAFSIFDESQYNLMRDHLISRMTVGVNGTFDLFKKIFLYVFFLKNLYC